MRERALIALGVLLAATAQAGEFVRVDGNRFVVGDARFVFVGANLEVMHGARNRAQAAATIAAARADGLSVGRVWALGEGDDKSPPAVRAHELFRTAPEAWVEAATAQLDAVVAAAGKSGLRLVIVLANSWGDYGGIPTYLRWVGQDPDARDQFYADEAVRAAFRDHVARVVGRTNALTGVRYADDPTIMAWELINESHADSRDEETARTAWLREMSALVRKLAPRQLVSAGVFGYTTRAERRAWRAACALPDIAYCDSHLYLESSDRVDDAARALAYVDDRAQLARHVVGKPLVLGEVGFVTERGAPPFLGQARAAWWRTLLAQARRDDVDGVLAWIYQPFAGRERDFGIYVDDARTDDVRRALAEAAQAGGARGDNPRLGRARGDALLYDAYRVLTQPRQGVVGAPEDTRVVSVSWGALDFARARWERVGTWAGGALAHVYGAGDGETAYAFELPRAVRNPRLHVAARLSSEIAGSVRLPPAGGGHAPSTVDVFIDQHRLGAISAPVDDGRGAVVTLDAAWSGASLARGPHVLRFVVKAPPRGDAEGLCVYGAPTGKAADAPAETPVTLELTSRQ